MVVSAVSIRIKTKKETDTYVNASQTLLLNQTWASVSSSSSYRPSTLTVMVKKKEVAS